MVVHCTLCCYGSWKAFCLTSRNACVENAVRQNALQITISFRLNGLNKFGSFGVRYQDVVTQTAETKQRSQPWLCTTDVWLTSEWRSKNLLLCNRLKMYIGIINRHIFMIVENFYLKLLRGLFSIQSFESMTKPTAFLQRIFASTIFLTIF